MIHPGTPMDGAGVGGTTVGCADGAREPDGVPPGLAVGAPLPPGAVGLAPGALGPGVRLAPALGLGEALGTWLCPGAALGEVDGPGLEVALGHSVWIRPPPGGRPSAPLRSTAGVARPQAARTSDARTAPTSSSRPGPTGLTCPRKIAAVAGPSEGRSVVWPTPGAHA